MPENRPVLHLGHVKKSFGDVEVLKDISIDVENGEVVISLWVCSNIS